MTTDERLFKEEMEKNKSKKYDFGELTKLAKDVREVERKEDAGLSPSYKRTN